MKANVAHTPVEIEHVLDTIERFEPALLIELGTLFGGLTLEIHNAFDDLQIITVDRRNKLSREVSEYFAKSKQITFHFMNLFDYDTRPNAADILRGADGIKKILYCDNGNKPLEFNSFAPFLNDGDLIGCHDWGTEIKYRDISTTIKAFKLKPYNRVNDKLLSQFWLIGGPNADYNLPVKHS